MIAVALPVTATAHAASSATTQANSQAVSADAASVPAPTCGYWSIIGPEGSKTTLLLRTPPATASAQEAIAATGAVAAAGQLPPPLRPPHRARPA